MRARGRSIPPPGSSAILQMCAEDNMQVANCTTPANYFHILRRQLKRDIRKPLIIMTPKSLLRHKRATSPLAMMDEGTTFHRLLWDDAEMIPGEAIKLAARRQDPPRHPVLRQGLLRSLRGAREARPQRHLPAARRAALSVAAQGADQHPLALQGCGVRVVPGRALQHGRLELRAAQHRARARLHRARRTRARAMRAARHPPPPQPA